MWEGWGEKIILHCLARDGLRNRVSVPCRYQGSVKAFWAGASKNNKTPPSRDRGNPES